MITFKRVPARVKVFLDEKLVGEIRQTGDEWWYVPKGHKVGGDKFPTLGQCKRSLLSEGENEENKS